jgi:hypothetical protein
VTGAQAATLVAALVLPVVGLLGPDDRRTASSGDAERRRRPATFRWPQAGVVVAAAAWLALVVSGAGGHAAGLHITPVVAAAGCGAALIGAASLEGMTKRRSQVATCVALVGVGAALTAGPDGAQAVAVVGGLAVAVFLTYDRGASRWGWAGSAPAFLGAAGVAAYAGGFVLLHDRSGRWTLPATPTLSAETVVAFVVGAALLSVYGTLGDRLTLRRGPNDSQSGPAAPQVGTRSAAILLAGGLALGLSAAPLRASTADVGVAAVVLAAAAVAAAGMRRGTLSLALLALAAAAGPPALAPGARLLAAAGVIAVAVGRPWVWLVAVPGAVSLAMGVVDDGGRLALATAVATAAVAVLLAEAAVDTLAGSEDASAAGPSWSAAGLSPPLGALPAVVAGTWLVIAAGTWTWTGSALGAYDQGMARAVAAGLLAVVGYVLAGQLGVGAGAGVLSRPGTGPPGGRQSSGASGPPSGSTPLPPARPRRRPTQLVRSKRSASPPRPRRPALSQRARPRARSSARPPKGARPPKPRRRPGPPEA